jgi:hypothetical protein
MTTEKILATTIIAPAGSTPWRNRLAVKVGVERP